MNNKVTFELEHLYKKYGKNKFYTTNDVSLKVNGGEVFGFLGPNGAGKSTIIKTTMGITSADKGKILICGVDVLKDPEKGKSLIGYVPDQYVLYEKLTGLEYLTAIGHIYRVKSSILEKRIKEYSDKFHISYALNRAIQTYSHGMKQKIALISALIHDPKLWLLDEPMTGLDPISVFQVKKTMREYADKGNIVFFSSHLIDIVKKICDRVAILCKGEIRAVVSIKELEKKNISLESYYLKIINSVN